MRWIAPPRNWAKLNCEGSSRGNPGHSGGGDLLRDYKGEMILTYGNYYGISTSLYAVNKVLCDGLEMANSKRLSHLWVEVDSMLLYNTVMSFCVVPWHLSYLFRKIISLLPAMFYISHNFREGNKSSDLMANMATYAQTSLCFEDNRQLPRELQGLLCLEKLGIPYIRMKGST